MTQALFAASLKAEALTGAGDLASPRVAGAVEEVRRLSRGALAQMRTMLLELRGDPLEEVPIEQLLRNVVEATESRTSTAVELTIDGAASLPATLHVALYRITQEALNNVARHARAAHARVHLELAPGRARLSVSDDGEGFTDGPVATTHSACARCASAPRRPARVSIWRAAPGLGRW